MTRCAFALLMVCSLSACSQTPTTPSATSIPNALEAADLLYCVQQTNAYRASIGRSALSQSAPLEAFAVEAALRGHPRACGASAFRTNTRCRRQSCGERNSVVAAVYLRVRAGCLATRLGSDVERRARRRALPEHRGWLYANRVRRVSERQRTDDNARVPLTRLS